MSSFPELSSRIAEASHFQVGHFVINSKYIEFEVLMVVQILPPFVFKIPLSWSTIKTKQLLHTLGNSFKPFHNISKLTQKHNYQYKSHYNCFILLHCHIIFLNTEKLNVLLRNSFENWLTAYLQLILQLKYFSSKSYTNFKIFWDQPLKCFCFGYTNEHQMLEFVLTT